MSLQTIVSYLVCKKDPSPAKKLFKNLCILSTPKEFRRR